MNLLLLADGRFPAGGHAHSGGMETAVAAGAVKDLETLSAFLAGRLATAGVSAAGLAAASCTLKHPWATLDAEADARTPSPALREVGRRQGRQMLRTARALWPGSILDRLDGASPAGPHHPVALGAAAAAAGLEPLDAARATIFNAVTAGASAAVRLLGLDPVTVHRLLATMAPQMDDIAHLAARAGDGPLEDLPCPGSILLDLYAQQHAESEMRLFAS